MKMRRRAGINKEMQYIQLSSLKSGIAGNIQDVPVPWFQSV